MGSNGVLYWNIRGLLPLSNKTKILYLRDLTILKNPLIIVLTETHLNSNILNAEVNIPGYTLYRSDREGRTHGGTCIYTRNDLATQQLVSHSNSVCETLVLKVKTLEIILVSIYRPPDTSLEAFTEAISLSKAAIDDTLEKDPKTKTILQFGDYNFPCISWPSKRIYQKEQENRNNKASEKEQAELFVDFMEENFLENLSLSPTRGRNILDLILSNNPQMVGPITITISSHISDHSMLEFQLNHPYTQPQDDGPKEKPYTTNFHKYRLDKGDAEDWMKYESLLREVNFDALVEGMNVKERLLKYYDILEKVVDAVFRKKKQYLETLEDEKDDENKRKPKNKIPKEIRLLMRQKHEISERIKKCKDWEKTFELSKQLEDKEIQLKEHYKERMLKVENEAIKRIKSDPNYFYTYAKKSSKGVSQVGTLVEADGSLCSDAFQKSECLRKQYESVFTIPNPKYIIKDPKMFYDIPDYALDLCDQCARQEVHLCPLDGWLVAQEEQGCGVDCSVSRGAAVHSVMCPAVHSVVQDYTQDSVQISGHDGWVADNDDESYRRRNPLNPEIANIYFNHQDIMDVITKLPNSASPGPDGMPPCLFKRAPLQISLMLENIFKLSFETGEIPDMLKLGMITPIHKGGSTSDPANFRPISLTSHVSKTAERLVREELVRHLEMSDKMDKCQHGSRRGRSTLSQLLEHHDEIIRMLENGENVDSVYLDFSKAFDKCDIGILMYKLKALSVTGKLLRWIHSFLSNRKQQVVVDGKSSKITDVKSGVPQGTVLGPLLFLIYIHDIGNNISAIKKVYVDDTKVKKGVKTEDDVEILQADLDKIYQWAKDNNMTFNGKKFQVMRYGQNEELKNNTLYLTEDANEVIERFETVKDLGVIMSEDATFNEHIEAVAKKVRQKTGWVLRTFFSRNQNFMKTMFKTLIVPHVDYCSQLWMPTTPKGIETIEKLQKHFFNRIPPIRQLNYWDQLKEMKMLSLQRRQERYRILYTWKILEGLIPNCGVSVKLEGGRVGRKCTIPTRNTQARVAVQTLREQTYQVHAPRLFNSLPADIRNITKCPLEDFKMALDVFLETVPDEPRVSGLTPGGCAESGPSNSLLHQVRRAAGVSRLAGSGG